VSILNLKLTTLNKLYKFKKQLFSINRFSNYSDRHDNFLNLDRNEKVIPLSKSNKKKFLQYLSDDNYELYPNLKSIYKKLSKFLKIESSNILLSEGVSGAIKNILDCIEVDKRTEVILPRPSFALYEVYSKIYGLNAKYYEYDKNFDLKIIDIYKLINKNTSIVFLIFPNIPVEGNISVEFIKTLAIFLKKKKILLVVDEVYYPFNNKTAISLIKNFSNIIVMRSFSKAYGLAGARIGYIVSQKSNIQIISKTKGGYESSMLSANALHFVLDNMYITKNYVRNMKLGMQFLKKNLQKLKIKFYGGVNSNFVFIDFQSIKKAKNIYRKLKSKKIMVRYGFGKPFNCGIMVTGCPLLQMKKFLKYFNKFY
jgi:histidinol-phosphate aminotransferase